jgi:hypothetical protein
MTPFQQAFADARAAGKKEFEFNGKPYHTRLKGEKAGGTTKVSVSASESKAPPRRPTDKVPVKSPVIPAVTTTKIATVSKPSGSGAIPTVVRRGGADTRPKSAVVAKTTTSSPATGKKTTTTMAALKANRRDFSRAGVEAKKMATMTGSKVARKK